MADKVTEEMGECGDPVLSRIGNFGKYQARVSGLYVHITPDTYGTSIQ